MAPVLLVEVEQEKFTLGLDYFCNQFDGENPFSPCGIPYVFLTLYQNNLSDDERAQIIHDINRHKGNFQLIHLYGLNDIDMLVTIKQNVKITLRKLLLNLRAYQSNTRLFLQVEKENDPASLLCAFDSVQYETVMENLPNISLFIRQCIIEQDFSKVFTNPDYSIPAPQKVMFSKKGYSRAKSVPLEVQEHTSLALSKMIKVGKRTSPTPSVSSFSNTSNAPSLRTLTSYSTTSSQLSQPPEIENRFRLMEQKIDSSSARMDSIE